MNKKKEIEELEKTYAELGEKIKKLKKEDELPNRWLDLNRIKGYYLGKYSQIIHVSSYLLPIMNKNENVFSTKEQAEASLELSMLSQLKTRYKDNDVLFWDRFKEEIYKLKPLLEIVFGEDVDAYLAMAELKVRMDEINGDWKPNWKNGCWYKYAINYREGGISKEELVSRKHFLVFKSAEMADKFIEDYKDLIEQAKPLL